MGAELANVLVLGSGGREDAIAFSLSKSPHVDCLFIAPGNGGTCKRGTNIDCIDIENAADILAFCKQHNVSLVVIGPEAPLVAGVADVLRNAGIDVFGPGLQGAMLEGSKTFSKEFMIANNLPTGRYASFDDEDRALEYLQQQSAPIVVKADGLAAGKGVIIAETLQQAQDAVRACFGGEFGSAGSKVVIEEFLSGPECSLLAFVTKGKAYCMAEAQDHKRAYDGDLGPNTGGMGVYSPVPIVSQLEREQMIDCMKRAAAATAIAPFDSDYRGVLYGGFMLTEQGPKLLEFNARFGDPETQVILSRLETDLFEVLSAVSKGAFETISLDWDDKWAVCVVLASEGYPGSYEKGRVILGVDEACSLEGVNVFHAGTALNGDGELVTAGGRVLNVVALADTFEEARALAYEACDLINFEGKQFRTDIGKRALSGRAAWEA